MTETEEMKPKEPAPKRSRWWWMGPLLVAAVVGLGVGGWSAWKHHLFEKERTETPPHVVADLKLKLLWIPADRSTMKTAVEAEVSKGFYLGETEVTQAQWEAVMGSNPSYYKGPNRPVENVNWEDCVNFCMKLTLRDRVAGRLGPKQIYRLPSMAEWEYACRSGNSGDFCFGNDESRLGEYAWFDRNSRNETHEVGTKRANAWGLCDMHGNVWEWSDWRSVSWGEYVSDPTKPAVKRDNGIMRGGCFYNPFYYCGSDFFWGVFANYRTDLLGFRLALSSIP